MTAIRAAATFLISTSLVLVCTASIAEATFSIAADKQCPEPAADQGYRPDKQYLERYKEGNVTKINIFGKFCSDKDAAGHTVVGHCKLANNCEGDKYQNQKGEWVDIDKSQQAPAAGSPQPNTPQASGQPVTPDA